MAMAELTTQHPAALLTPLPTPWGPAGAVVVCLLPILFLILVTMVKRIMLPSRVGLPAAAALMAAVRLAYLSAPPLEVLPAALDGCLEALIPLSVVFGAIALFKTMEYTKCMPWMMLHVKSLSAGNPVAEVFLIGWAFACTIEGIGGFGAPVALGAPMLVSLGHEPLPSVVVLVILNSLCSHLGSVGMVVWFSFNNMGLGDANILLIGAKATVMVGVGAFVCAPMAASSLVPWREIFRNWLFICLSLLSAIVPTFVVAMYSQDFPVVVGGAVSVLVTGVLIVYRVGLKPPLPNTAGTLKRTSSLHATPGADIEAAHGRKQSAAAYSAADQTSAAAAWAPDSNHNRLLTRGDIESCSMSRISTPFVVQRTASGRSSRSYSRPSSRACSTSARMTAAGGLHTAAAAAAASGTAAHRSSSCKGSFSAAAAAAFSLPKTADIRAADDASDLALCSDASQTITAPSLVSPGSVVVPVAELVEVPPLTLRDTLLRSMPIWLTVLILLITRVPQMKVKGLVTSTSPSFAVDLGTLGKFSMSSSLVLQLSAILTSPDASFTYQLLYVPCILPFIAAAVITLLVHRRDLDSPKLWTAPFKEAYARMAGTVAAMMGALALAEMIRTGGAGSPAFIVGYYFSAWLGKGYVAVAGLLGALSSFVGGSVMAGNLTFGDIQKVAAVRIGVPVTSMLALQDATCCAGKMICIANILACKAVMNLSHVGEGELIKRTALPALVLIVASTAVSCLFLFAAPGQQLVWPDHPLPAA
uniref:L-lactate permease n=1 Tax=Tetradesmus obliquus TaxID=3088 RepID=A0A383V6N0_TETOB|eukprot:jgi/Sobl393_1/8121/SZX59996.1